MYDVLREHVWAEEEGLRGARAVAREAGARVGLEETGKRADELLEVIEARKREERPAEGGVIEFCALGAAVLTPLSRQMCRLLLRVPLIERGTSAVAPQSGTVGSYEVRKV